VAEVVVVTGAGAGLGRAIASSFARRGAAVGLIARGEERLEDACREVEALGGRGLMLPLDVADAQAVEEAAARVEAELGAIDVWVNNAMTTVFSPLRDMSAEEFRRVTEVSYLGYAYGTLAALKHMLPRDHGTIVQVGSALAYRSIPLQSAYCGAKHAIVGFTDSLRTELLHEHSRVHVTAVHMPAINTPQFGWGRNRKPRRAQPVAPIYQPEVCAEAVYWAAHRRVREVFVGAPTLRAVWGQRFLPGWLDRYLVSTWDGQMYDGAPPPDARDNLFSPVPGHQGAHGTFDSQARDHSTTLEWTMRGVDFALRLMQRGRC
jgi:short-subunit dehydrogenase